MRFLDGLDGCYRCLFAFEAQRDLPNLSREVAVEMLGEILAKRDQLESVRTLADVRLDERLDSELERLFIERLDATARSRGWGALQKDSLGTKAIWRLEVGGRRWVIEPQVLVGDREGVDISSKPDFVIRTEDGEPGIRPVALFCDGAAYHVQAGQPKGRVSGDLAKREALRKSGQFVVWSPTWEDVKELGNGERSTCAPWLGVHGHKAVGSVWNHWHVGPHQDLLAAGAGDVLLAYLENPDPQRWSRFSLAAAVAWASSGPGVDPDQADELEDWLVNEPRRPASDPRVRDGSVARALARRREHPGGLAPDRGVPAALRRGRAARASRVPRGLATGAAHPLIASVLPG